MYLNHLGILCALGEGQQSILQRWLAADSPQAAPVSWLNSRLPAYQVSCALPELPTALARFNCRNNRLLLAAYQQIAEPVQQAITQYGAQRVAVIIGTSTSGNDQGERAVKAWHDNGQLPADFDYVQQELGGAAQFLAALLDLQGPAYSISTSCSSSANALASARRLLQLGVCDAVLVGGVDSLCDTTLQGFSALGALSQTRCNPFSVNRDGTLLGEGAALFLMSREPADIALLGVGASSDAYHISTPRPDGACALQAMQQALSDAQISPDQVDYLNLHGTGTPQNDAMESLIVAQLFGQTTACSSSKSVTGHCLGAAGAIEAALCWLLLSDLNSKKRLPAQLWDGIPDPALPALGWVGVENPPLNRLQYALSNSFAFGGSNVSLLIGRSSNH